MNISDINYSTLLQENIGMFARNGLWENNVFEDISVLPFQMTIEFQKIIKKINDSNLDYTQIQVIINLSVRIIKQKYRAKKQFFELMKQKLKCNNENLNAMIQLRSNVTTKQIEITSKFLGCFSTLNPADSIHEEFLAKESLFIDALQRETLRKVTSLKTTLKWKEEPIKIPLFSSLSSCVNDLGSRVSSAGRFQQELAQSRLFSTSCFSKLCQILQRIFRKCIGQREEYHNLSKKTLEEYAECSNELLDLFEKLSLRQTLLLTTSDPISSENAFAKSNKLLLWVKKIHSVFTLAVNKQTKLMKLFDEVNSLHFEMTSTTILSAKALELDHARKIFRLKNAQDCLVDSSKIE